MPRKRTSRIYTRTRNGITRHYADFRDYADVGGGREALVATGEVYATTDPDVATELARTRLQQLESARRGRALVGEADRSLEATAGERLVAVAEAGTRGAKWLADNERMLQRAVHYFDVVQPAEDPVAWAARRMPKGARLLASITPADVRGYLRWLRKLPSGRKRPDGTPATQSQQSVRHHLAALSGVYEFAISEGYIRMGRNPVAALQDKPAVPRSRTPLREPQDLALLLESARTFDPAAEGLQGAARGIDCAYELVAFMLYTGVREDEARRVDVRDVHFGGPMGPWVLIRGADKGSRRRDPEEMQRVLPMHPHLVEILRPYVRRLDRLSGPAFPGRDGRPFGNWSKVLDRIAERAGWEAGEIRTRQFRVAYATHRCTCDGVDVNQVRLELGHTDLSQMANVYARAQRRSERMGPEMSYRLERWEHRADPLRLARLQRPSRSTREVRAEERARVVRAFLAAVASMGPAEVMRETGVDDAVLNRLRSRAQRDVKGRTLERMRTYLEGQAEQVA